MRSRGSKEIRAAPGGPRAEFARSVVSGGLVGGPWSWQSAPQVGGHAALLRYAARPARLAGLLGCGANAPLRISRPAARAQHGVPTRRCCITAVGTPGPGQRWRRASLHRQPGVERLLRRRMWLVRRQRSRLHRLHRHRSADQLPGQLRYLSVTTSAADSAITSSTQPTQPT
eukprot:6451606-Prymnesium_polylepis.1